jgi:8-oxo-dGTP diphosphatase
VKSKSVAILIINQKGEVLQMLRDDKLTIKYPNTWVSIGGRVEEAEIYKEVIIREVYEELEIELDSVELFKIYKWPEKTEAVFVTHLDFDPNTINLHEDQRIEFFTKEKLSDLDLGFHGKEILNDFFNQD